jgi:integrase
MLSLKKINRLANIFKKGAAIMGRTTYTKKTKNGKEYYFYRLRHKNLKKAKDIYDLTVKGLSAKIKAATIELDQGIAGNREYFGEYLKEWLYNTHMMNKKPSTKERYDGIFRNYIEDSPLYTIKLCDLTALDVQGYYKDLIKKGKTVSNVKFIHKLVAPCIRYAYNSNKLIKDFSKAIILPKDLDNVDRSEFVNPFTVDEQKAFMKAIEGDDLEILYITALDTGMRQGELFALTWKDIDFINKKIRITKTYKVVRNIETGKQEGLINEPKSNQRIRTIPIPAHILKRLRQYRTDQKEHKLKMANIYNDNNLVFCNIFGNYLDSSNVLKIMKKILDKNNIQEKRFHDLRHTYATRLFELGENPKTVQKLLGHSSLAITLDTYTHVLDAMKEQAVSKIDDLYEKWSAE